VAAGGAGGAEGDAADPPLVVGEEACWGPDLPAEESLEEAEDEAGRVVLASIIKIRIQKQKKRKRTRAVNHSREAPHPHPAWKTGIASSLRLVSRMTGGAAPPLASPVAVAGPAAAAGAVVAVGPAATAGAVAVVAPGTAVGAEAAVVVVAAAAKSAAASQASPAAAVGDGAVAAEPGSYFAP
jgi:hypothetical protein